MSYQEEQNKTFKKIKATKVERRLIPFIGAGFSKNINGYPDWNGFIKNLSNDIKKPELPALFNNNNLEACEYYIWEKANQLSIQGGLNKNDKHFLKGKEKLLELVKNMFVTIRRNTANDAEWYLHDKMMDKFDYLYTTNWDDALEQAKITSRMKIKPIYTRAHLSTAKYLDGAKGIVKIHGHYEDIHAESLIACQKDYNKRIIEENPFDIKFKNDLLHNSFFFIGYSFGDPNILLMIDLIQQLTEEILPVFKSNIFWISAENYGDPRVELIEKSLGIQPYYLLKKSQQKELESLKNDLKNKCNSCAVKKKTDAHIYTLLKLCENCKKPEKKIFQDKKTNYIKMQTEHFLDNI